MARFKQMRSLAFKLVPKDSFERLAILLQSSKIPTSLLGKKMFSNLRARAELKRLNSISQNENPTEWEKENAEAMKIYSLNCRSLKKHYLDIISDDQLLKSDAILLQETWLDEDTPLDNFLIPGFELQLNSKGRGKGLATYYRKNKFSHSEDTKREHFQMTKLTSASIDIISIYRSQNGNPMK